MGKTYHAGDTVPKTGIYAEFDRYHYRLVDVYAIEGFQFPLTKDHQGYYKQLDGPDGHL